MKQAGLMSFFVVGLSLGFYLILLNFGHLLHGIDSLEKLQSVITKHHHPI
jgi:tellurite resistance protein TerC